MKKVIIILLFFAFIFVMYQTRMYAPSLNDSISYSSRSHKFKGKIYIGDEKYLDSLNEVSENDVLILDQRYISNPNFRIYNSYKINNIEEINYILEYLLEYEKNNPSRWDRTIASMRNEWISHNIAYQFNIDVNRSKDLDLDNEDQDKYNFWW